MITSYETKRIGYHTTVTVESDLTSTPVWYHWYRDGVWVHSGTIPSHSFYVERGGQAVIECVDSASPNYDELANAPDAWPATRTVFWWPSMDDDVKEYRVEKRKDAGSWEMIEDGRIRHDQDTWLYQAETGRLDDLSTYEFRVVPVDEAGNDGTAQEIESEIVVRTPDAERYSLAFSAGTSRVTFSAV